MGKYSGTLTDRLRAWAPASSNLYSLVRPVNFCCYYNSYISADDGTVSVKNSALTADGLYREICGYAEVPNPELPGELQASLNISE